MITAYLVICISSFFAAVLTLFSGFGLSTILLPTFCLFFPLNLAIASIAIVHLANNLFKLILVGTKANIGITLKFAIPAMLSAIFGAWVLIALGELEPVARYHAFGRDFSIEPIKLTIGILIAIFSFLELIPSLKIFTLPKKYIPIGGLIAGFFGGLSGLQGALRTMFLIHANLSKEQFIGTTVLCAVIIDLSRITVYGYAIFAEHLSMLKAHGIIWLVVAAIIAALIGSILGARLIKKTTFKAIQYIISVLLFLTALGLITGIL